MHSKPFRASQMLESRKKVGVQSNVLRKSNFDTKNFHYLLTELRKEQYSR